MKFSFGFDFRNVLVEWIWVRFGYIFLFMTELFGDMSIANLQLSCIYNGSGLWHRANMTGFE